MQPPPQPTVPTRPGLRRRALHAVTAASLVLAVLATAGATVAPAADAAPLPAPETGSRFTLAVLPDTQFYSRYSASQFLPRYGTDPFSVQTNWLAENAEALNVPFVAHVGDVVDRVGSIEEWVAADAAMAVLDDADLPYSVLPGNHDVLNSADDHVDTDYDLDAEPYLQWFGPDRAAQQSTHVASDTTGLNTFHIFEAEGQQFGVLALTWRASDATLAWADAQLAANPTVPVILTTHSLLNVEADGVTPLETEYGLRLWDDLIRNNDQIFLTFNGHFHGASRLDKVNDFGHTVTQIVIDYQMAYEGGNGYLGLYEFDLSANTINAVAASPWVTFKPQDTLTRYDQPFLTGPHQEFAIDIDFAERFTGFNDSFGPGEDTWPPLTQRARDLLLTGFEGPDPIGTSAPGNAIDYVEVDGTLAHWRIDTAASGTLAEGATVTDIAGDGDLHRVTLAESGSATAEVDDVTVVTEGHPLSADAAGICFANTDQRTDRFSYLSTEPGAAVNNADLSEGYTIETFVMIDPAWTAEANAWSKLLVRSGNRSALPGMPWSQWDYTASPAALGISNLKEFQWTEVPERTEAGDRTAWSGEILFGRWMHVALVNDPAAATTTMYVDGAPVLRNTVDTIGQSFNAGMPWILGADWVDDAARNGWNGCVGETRIIDHPTGPQEWLTARADLSGLTVEAPTGDLPAGMVIESFTGTGFPGAEVRLEGAQLGTAGAMAPTPMVLDASTTVAADGTWTITLPGPLPAGNYTATLFQALGSRASSPTAMAFRVTATVDPPITDPGSSGGAGDQGTPGGSGDPGGSGADDQDDDGVGAPSSGPSGSGLASTGAAGLWVLVGGALLAGVLGLALQAANRRGTRQ
ncbi:LamG-like jellyroll fold domain-containing protein [Occultella kanbiaonis]|uniref:LamG-like jellyroll fold domain-containing protein n=1 Tax=Occultella kanbiaonis TaxID=2675754 RepID=UPI001A98AB0A|nr:metallophosphoesterase [Occultella kanbiaonis]